MATTKADIQLALFGPSKSVERPSSPAPGRQRARSSSRLVANSRARERFWENVVKGPDNECWIWCGAISSPDGYGRFTWQVDGVRRTLSAHRFALLLARGGELSEGLVGEHSCCEPLCVRVGDGHLHVTAQSANIAYAVDRGRHLGTREVVGSYDRHARSLRVRAAVIDGWDSGRLAAARSMAGPAAMCSPLWEP